MQCVSCIFNFHMSVDLSTLVAQWTRHILNISSTEDQGANHSVTTRECPWFWSTKVLCCVPGKKIQVICVVYIFWTLYQACNQLQCTEGSGWESSSPIPQLCLPKCKFSSISINQRIDAYCLHNHFSTTKVTDTCLPVTFQDMLMILVSCLEYRPCLT